MEEEEREKKMFPKSVSKKCFERRKQNTETASRMCSTAKAWNAKGGALAAIFILADWRIAALRLNRKYVALETASFGWK